MTQAPSERPPPSSRSSGGSATLTIVASPACIAVATISATVAIRRCARLMGAGSRLMQPGSLAPPATSIAHRHSYPASPCCCSHFLEYIFNHSPFLKTMPAILRGRGLSADSGAGRWEGLVKPLTMLATPDGKWVFPNSAEFFAALGDSDPDYDALAFAFKN